MFSYYARVLEIIDGDTIDIAVDLGFNIQHIIRVRLHGINTPELRSKDAVVKGKAIAARNRLVELIEGKIVHVETIRDSKEKYGRYLAVITANETNINQQLISEGLATPYFGEKRI